MPNFSPEDIAQWTGGTWTAAPPESVSGVSVDTRTLRPGDLYLAIRGPNFDGHQFLGDAFGRGAAGAVIAKDFTADSPIPGPLLVVDDTCRALTALAGGHRQRLTATMVGVTGSVGKTTVKELAAAMLGLQ